MSLIEHKLNDLDYGEVLTMTDNLDDFVESYPEFKLLFMSASSSLKKILDISDKH